MSKHSEHDILGETNSKPQKESAKAPIRKPRLAESVLFVSNGDNDFVKHVAIVIKIHPAVGDHTAAVDLTVLKDSFIDFRKKVPYSEEVTSGSYQWLK